jgi:hypothetical protein
MKPTRTRIAALVVLAGAAICAAVALAATGVKTSKPPYVVGTAPGVVVDPILSTGDIVPQGQMPPYQMSGIPDGLGAYANHGKSGHDGRHGKKKTYTVLMNHELGITFPGTPPGVNTRISQLTVDAKSNSVLSAKYVFKGIEGFERFCSATLALIHGKPWYFTGEEAINGIPPAPPAGHDGSSIALNASTGQWFETAHFGHLQHENVVPAKLKKWFFLTTDDDFRAGFDAHLYAYIADSFQAAISGDQSKGSLYVWKADSAIDSTQIHKGQTLSGHFVPITQAENANSVTLKNAAAAKGAFKFDRLEDAALYKQKKGRFYFADTGKRPRTIRGRIYQFDVNPGDPTQASLKLVLDGDAGDDLYNPDNLDTAKGKIVFQEDRESEFRDPPFSGGYGRVMVYDIKSGTLQSVARVNTPPPLRPGTWESSGVINASKILGKGWWLLDVQAHSTTAPQPGPTLVPNSSTGEDGQLLAVYIPQTLTGHGHGHDDDHGHGHGKRKKR